MIWTTTPWTLPANLAIAVHPEIEYVGGRRRRRAARLVVAQGAPSKLATPSAATSRGSSRHLQGADAREASRTRHPWLDRESPIVLGEHVTLEAGTGARAHRARARPGGLRGRPALRARRLRAGRRPRPLHPRSRATSAACRSSTPMPKIIAHLETTGSLAGRRGRSRTLSALLALPQADHLPRDRAVVHLDGDRGSARSGAGRDRSRRSGSPRGGAIAFAGMVSSRPDWCVSRQRRLGRADRRAPLRAVR